MKSLYVTCFALAAMAFTGCADNSSYFMNNGNCVSNEGVVVNPTYCGVAANGYNNGINGYNNGYYMNAGQCYSSTTQQVVDVTHCTNVNNMSGSFYMQNGACYSTSTRQIVGSNYCAGLSSSQCIGTYYNGVGAGAQPVQCNGANCSGYTLYNAQGTMTYCQ